MRRIILASVLAIVTLGLLWHVGCTKMRMSTSPRAQSASEGEPERLEEGQVSDTVTFGGYADAEADPSATSFWWQRNNPPDLDLQDVLQSNRGGGGESPFRQPQSALRTQKNQLAQDRRHQLLERQRLTPEVREILSADPDAELPPPRQENSVVGSASYFEDTLDSARQVLAAGDIDNATAILQEFLQTLVDEGSGWLSHGQFELFQSTATGMLAQIDQARQRQETRIERARQYQVADLFDQAREKQAAMDYDAALALVEEALKIDPDNESAQLLCDIYTGVVKFQNDHDLRRATSAAYARARTIPDADIINFPADWPRHSMVQASRKMADQMAAFSGATPSLDEEIWVIAKPDDWDIDTGDGPGCGALLTTLPDMTDPVPVPLEHTDVRANIAGHIASTIVTQSFHNPFEVKIEATYVFPLPQRAAVNEFVMTVGERRIRGIIRERAEAERIYAQARAAGHTASLLTQERPNVFTQKVANIEPGHEIDIEITYFHTLPYRDGSFEYVFPMVVGPRFNPPHQSDGIGAVARGANGASGQATEVQYLAPNERSGHDVSIQLAIDAGVEIGHIRSKSHTIGVRRDSLTMATVRLEAESTIPNKDFVLRYDVAGDDVRTAMVTTTDPITGERFFSMLIVPPELPEALERRPMELVFVLDASGSMSGKPIAQAKDAITRALDMLGPQDTFQVIRFSENASSLGAAPLEASTENIALAKRRVASIQGGGGTMMIEGIKSALDFPHDEARTRYVVFLTDGFIGNEVEILGEMRSRLGSARVFSFGVGSSPNRYLIERMAKLGRGAVAYLSLEDSGAEVMGAFFERASRPAITGVSIDWGDMQVVEVNPPVLPDVYSGRPISVTGRIVEGDGQVRILGAGPGGHVELTPDIESSPDSLKAVRAIWARGRIAEMLDEATFEPSHDLPSRVRDLALSHALMSPFTAFVAVDSTRFTSGGPDVSMTVPVHVPAGVSYEATVTEDR